MDGHTRMARTLACLVASMTIGAVVLDWVQPNQPPTNPSGIELIARHVRNAIHQPAQAQGSVINQRWHSIQIIAQHSGATPEPGEAHFQVDHQGNWAETDCWRAQKYLEQEGVVQIGLLTPANSSQITSPQWLAAKRLIQGLQELCAIPAGQIHQDISLTVPIDSPPARSPNLLVGSSDS